MDHPPDGVDLTVNLNGNKIRVHKSILIEKSEYFRAMLTSDFIEAHSNEVKINFDVDIDIFNLILNYIYTDEIEVSTANMKCIYNAAEYFMLEDLKRRCLVDRVNCETVEEIHNFAVEKNLNDVSKIAFDFKVKHFERVLKTRSFLNWKLESVEEVLQSDRVVVSEENKVLKFVTSWVGHDLKRRSKIADGLLQNIRFQHLEKLENMSADENSRKFVFTFPSALSSNIVAPRQYQKGIYIKESGDFLTRYCPIDGTATHVTTGECFDSFSKPVVIDEKLHYFNRAGILSVRNGWTNQCESKASINYPFNHELLSWSFMSIPICCSFKDSIYAFKGCREDIGRDRNLWRHVACCVKSNTWTEISDLPADIAQSGIHSATTCGDSIYLVQDGSTNLVRYTPSSGKSGRASCSDITCPYNLQKYKVVAHETKLIFLEPDSNGHLIVFDTVTKVFKQSFSFPDENKYSDIVMYNDYICLLSRTYTSLIKIPNSDKVEVSYPLKMLNADFMDKPMYYVEPLVTYRKKEMSTPVVVYNGDILSIP